MKERHLFEYAVIRVVPRVEREEFLNVGVILYCKKLMYLQTIYKLDREKLVIFTPTLELKEVEEYLQAFERICKGDTNSGPIGQLDLASRFRWLTATRSTVVQCSKVHPGFCENIEEALQRLYKELVL